MRVSSNSARLYDHAAMRVLFRSYSFQKFSMKTSFHSDMKALAASLTIAVFSLSSIAFADTLGPITPSVDGFYLQWTPKTGSTHYVMVDETTCNGTTDYNSETTIGHRDSYGVSLGSVPNGAKITQVSITPCASKHKSGGSNSTMNVFYRFSGVNSADAGTYSLAGTTPVNLATTSFTSLSHLKSSASTLEVGAVLVAGGKGARLGRIAVQITYDTLNAPSGLSATPSGTQVALNWTDNTVVEDGFKIERSTDGVNFTQIGTTGVNVTNFTDTTSVADTTYTYRVRAYNAAADSSPSNTATAATVPNAPSNLFAYASGPLVYLTWTDHSQVEQGFEIERSTDGVNFDHIVSTAENSTGYTDSGSVANTNYWYRVRAFNASGPSAYSTIVTVATIPASPSNLTTTPNGGGVVILNWVDNALTETHYHVERKTAGTGSFVLIGGFLSPNTTTHPDYAGSGTHTYRVRASNDAGFSDYSNESTIILP